MLEILLTTFTFLFSFFSDHLFFSYLQYPSNPTIFYGSHPTIITGSYPIPLHCSVLLYEFLDKNTFLQGGMFWNNTIYEVSSFPLDVGVDRGV